MYNEDITNQGVNMLLTALQIVFFAAVCFYVFVSEATAKRVAEIVFGVAAGLIAVVLFVNSFL